MYLNKKERSFIELTQKKESKNQISRNGYAKKPEDEFYSRAMTVEEKMLQASKPLYLDRYE